MVYLARDPAFERQVAIKVIPPQYTQDPQFRARFEREAKVIAGLEHPYIVPVYDYGEEGDQPYIVMRFMPGGTLADRIYGKPMPLSQVIPIITRLADAVDAAHRQNIIHCDLKPSNVLFDVEGRAFLSDFGIAKLLEAAGAAAPGGASLIGTPAYMSPEQCAGETTIDGRSDVYSLGLILYEMLNGYHPYGDASDTTELMLRKQISEPPPPLDTDQLKLPGEINAVLAWALAKQPDARYPTASALARALGTLYDAPAVPTPSKPLVPLARPDAAAPTPPNRDNSTHVLEQTRPLGRLSARSLILGLPLVLGLVGIFALINIFGGGRQTPTPTPPQPTTAVPQPSLTSTTNPALLVTLLASATTSATPTATASASPTETRPTSTPTATATETPAPPTRTRAPTFTPTATPTPVCIPPEFFDPFLGRCRLPDSPPAPTNTPAPP